jgi:hypothetical protein
VVDVFNSAVSPKSSDAMRIRRFGTAKLNERVAVNSYLSTLHRIHHYSSFATMELASDGRFSTPANGTETAWSFRTSVGGDISNRKSM